MSEIGRSRRRRVDADRNASTILAAATDMLGDRPLASMEEIAAGAGVSRQTIYAHFPTRAALVDAVVAHVTAAVAAALDDLDPDRGSATDALGRWLETSWSLLAAYPVLLQPAVFAPDPARDVERHEPVAGTLRALIRRGQRSGEFDRRESLDWLLAAILALGHAAAQAATSGAMTTRAAGRAYRAAALRVVTHSP